MTEPHPSSDSCPFCTIAHSYAPHPTTTTTSSSSLSLPSQNSPSSQTQTSDSPSSNPFPPTNTHTPTYLLLSTPLVLAFLDIMPITRGHVLVATRAHRPKLSDVTVAEARALGVWVGVVSRAVVRALGMGGQSLGEGEGEGEGMGDWNVVQNNGARAAQVVPHVHFHIIPRPGDVPNIEHKSWTVFGKGQREELDEEDAEGLVRRMREELGREVARVREREGVDLDLDLDGQVGVEVGKVRDGRIGREKL